MSKLFIGGFLFLGLLIAGFILLLRSCLAQFDERFALAPVLYFERDGRSVLFSLVQYDETNNYSRNGGMVNKSVTTSYLVQQQDGVTGARQAMREIKEHRDIKNFPVDVLGASGQLAWVFMGELMAFDPFTLKVKADVSILERSNPSLKGKFPAERRYYQFDPADGQLYFTASDGSKWQLNTTTLAAVASDRDPDKNAFTAAKESVEQAIVLNRGQQDSLYKNEYPGKLYSQGKISASEYQRRQIAFAAHQKALYRERDSLYQVQSVLRTEESQSRQLESAIASLQRSHPSFSQIKVNQDTIDGRWMGLYDREEFEQLYDRVAWRPAYEEAARRQLYVGEWSTGRNGDLLIDKEKARVQVPDVYFLEAGFLVDKKTALPIRLSGPAGYLVIHKDKIGREGLIQVTRIGLDGKAIWKLSSGLADWVDWLYTGRQLFLLGVSNPELSGTQANLLQVVDLATGKVSSYDYFEDRGK
ncbi:PA2928 family protein [Paraflavitalea pollutisoli]|uniref:PA2928 family protein n=1 Tax=Paraflavitalea pollutisoli TaxID=3034143 RepID=UPI0023ECF4AE|nr:PA2928 family protein [Paraflavitalea sp. H1-2-19X]